MQSVGFAFFFFPKKPLTTRNSSLAANRWQIVLPGFCRCHRIRTEEGGSLYRRSFFPLPVESGCRSSSSVGASCFVSPKKVFPERRRRRALRSAVCGRGGSAPAEARGEVAGCAARSAEPVTALCGALQLPGRTRGGADVRQNPEILSHSAVPIYTGKGVSLEDETKLQG